MLQFFILSLIKYSLTLNTLKALVFISLLHFILFFLAPVVYFFFILISDQIQNQKYYIDPWYRNHHFYFVHNAEDLWPSKPQQWKKKKEHDDGLNKGRAVLWLHVVE